jgi:acetyltransferase-like isoleucine patch superfamily enzyme
MARAPEGRLARVRRAASSSMSLGAGLHLARMLHFYNYDHVQPRRRIVLGPEVSISPTASFRNGERITLGRRVHVGSLCHLWAGDTGGRIVLGDHVLLGPQVFITVANYQTQLGQVVMDQPKEERDVVVGNDCWLGARVMVMPGVTIGEGCVVGAGSVVTKDLPPRSIAVGVPARVVGSRLQVVSAAS